MFTNGVRERNERWTVFEVEDIKVQLDLWARYDIRFSVFEESEMMRQR